MNIAATRDGWDILVIVATVVGAAAACIAAVSVFPIFQQLRRRPELKITWEHDYSPWPSSKALAIPIGGATRVRVGLHNVGDAGGESSIANVVLALPFELQQRLADGSMSKGKRSGNAIAGVAPDHAVTFIAAERRFYVGMSWIIDFEIRSLQLPADLIPPPGDYKLLLDFSDDRLNRSGRRVRWVQSARSRTLVRVRTEPVESAKDTGVRQEWRVVRATPIHETVPGLKPGESGLVDLLS